jgi:hypothetical protein
LPSPFPKTFQVEGASHSVLCVYEYLITLNHNRLTNVSGHLRPNKTYNERVILRPRHSQHKTCH